MPELPEVETVRRGLQPAMEGARFAQGRGAAADLRWPLPKDFAERLDGQTVTGLGRRAKYLLADLSSGDVLLMHLGMSGSFRVAKGDASAVPGDFHHPRAEARRARPCGVSHVVRRDRDLQRSAPLRLHEAHAARTNWPRQPLLRGSAPSRSAMHSTPPCWRAPARARKPA